MGQAKKRGTFVERQQAAYDAVDARTVSQAEHLQELERMEAESKAMYTGNINRAIIGHWNRTGMQRRMTASTGIFPENLPVSSNPFNFNADGSIRLRSEMTEQEKEYADVFASMSAKHNL